MKKYKKQSIIFLFLIISTPFIIIFFVINISSRINAEYPYGFRDGDKPLYSYMHFTKNYSGYLYKYNIYTGFQKLKHTTNSYGLRGSEIDFSKPIVLMSGDSILFGLMLDDKQNLPYYLQQKLKNCTVINAGVPGKAIGHNLLTLQYFIEEAKKYHAKIQYFINYINEDDFKCDKSKEIETIKKKWHKTILPFKQKLAVWFPNLYNYYAKLKDISSVNGYIINFIKSFFNKNRVDTNFEFNKQQKDINVKFCNTQISYIKQINKICKKNNIILINVITPYSKEEIFSKVSKSELVKDKLKQLGLKNIILVTNIYHENKNYNLIPRDGVDWCHVSPYAFKVVSKYLHRYIMNLEKANE